MRGDLSLGFGVLDVGFEPRRCRHDVVPEEVPSDNVCQPRRSLVDGWRFKFWGLGFRVWCLGVGVEVV